MFRCATHSSFVSATSKRTQCSRTPLPAPRLQCQACMQSTAACAQRLSRTQAWEFHVLRTQSYKGRKPPRVYKRTEMDVQNNASKAWGFGYAKTFGCAISKAPYFPAGVLHARRRYTNSAKGVDSPFSSLIIRSSSLWVMST